MEMNLKAYAAVLVAIGAIIAVQILAARGSIALIMLLSLINAFIAALFSMGLKYEPPRAVAYIWLVPTLFTAAFIVGMLTA